MLSFSDLAVAILWSSSEKDCREMAFTPTAYTLRRAKEKGPVTRALLHFLVLRLSFLGGSRMKNCLTVISRGFIRPHFLQRFLGMGLPDSHIGHSQPE
jgi:hypothetical protein